MGSQLAKLQTAEKCLKADEEEAVFDQEVKEEKPKRPVTKKVSKKAIKAQAARVSTPRKKRQKKMIESVMKPFPRGGRREIIH